MCSFGSTDEKLWIENRFIPIRKVLYSKWVHMMNYQIIGNLIALYA
jgi:hypothetical protein